MNLLSILEVIERRIFPGYLSKLRWRHFLIVISSPYSSSNYSLLIMGYCLSHREPRKHMVSTLGKICTVPMQQKMTEQSNFHGMN